MSVKNRVIELNKLLKQALNRLYIQTDDTDTTTSLIQKLSVMPVYTTKSTDLVPNPADTATVEYPPLYDAEHPVNGEPMVSANGVEYDAEYDRYVTKVTEYEKAWPHFRYIPLTPITVPLSYSRLLVDVEHSDQFNMSVWYKGKDDTEEKQAWLSHMVGLETVDFQPDRTSRRVNFGGFVMSQGHTNSPKVTQKVDLLQMATGQSFNYAYEGGMISFGNNAGETTDIPDDPDPLMPAEDYINLNETPYLYYSINQPDTSKMTFAIYTNSTTPKEGETYSCWYMVRDGKETTTSEMFAIGGDIYSERGQDLWFAGPQTGCIDLRAYIPENMWTTFRINELKLYGWADSDAAAEGNTEATINYLFMGNTPTDWEYGWGNPAVPSAVFGTHAAVGGTVDVTKIDYYVVGSGIRELEDGTIGDWIKIHDVTFAVEGA